MWGSMRGRGAVIIIPYEKGGIALATCIFIPIMPLKEPVTMMTHKTHRAFRTGGRKKKEKNIKGET